jgi:hypothetical protein
MRNLKILGLGLVAMLAMSAMAASSASASFSSTDEHTFLTGSGKDNIFRVTPNQRGFECDKVELNTNTSTFLEADKTAEQITVGPKYEECVTVDPSGFSAFVEMTGCHYLFTDETKEGKAPVHVVCEQETEEIHVKVTALKLVCSTIPGTNTANVGKGETHNQNLTGVTYTNNAINANHVDVTADIAGITSTTQGGCQAEGEPIIHHGGTYKGSVTVSGHDTVGNIEDLSYTG